MKSFPLHPFLISLAADGIRPTIRDYERIALALRSGGTWTIRRLRDVLLALIVKDEDQQDIFLLRFNQYFDTGPGTEHTFSDIDIEKALADLKQLASQKIKSGYLKYSYERSGKHLINTPVRDIKKRWIIWPAIFVTTLILYFAISPFLRNEKKGKPILRISPNIVDFGHLPPGEKSPPCLLLLKNMGSVGLIIYKIQIVPSDVKEFTSGAVDSINIAIGDSVVIPLIFKSDSPGLYSASLEITSNSFNSPQLISLRGICVQAPISPILQKQHQRRYTNVPSTDIKDVHIQQSNGWKSFACIALFFLLATLSFGIYLWRSHKIPEDKPPEWDETGPRHFSLGSIGGKPVPRLMKDTLDQLADSMGYFMSELPGKNLRHC